MRKSLIAGAIALSLLSPNVYALSVGSMEVDSHLGEPLDISIQIDSIDQDEFTTLEVSLASREMFREAGIEYPRDAQNLKLELGPYDNGRVTISVKTVGAVSDPFLHLLIRISWSGGNILREYTALIDPSDYQAEPIVQAAAPETSLGFTKTVTAASQDASGTQFRTVQPGESLSSIATLYRPSNVTVQQAWLAIFNLNQDAFPDANLNNLQKGARLQIPTEAQMNEISAAEAAKQVTALTRPLGGEEMAGTPESDDQEPKAATLVVGGGGEGDDMAADASSENTQNMPLSESNGGAGTTVSDGSTGSIVTEQPDGEMGAINQDISKEITDSRDRDSLIKEELIATRGENKVLTNRMSRLEAQLSRMSELLELQSNALKALNSNLEQGSNIADSGQTQDQALPADTAAPLDTNIQVAGDQPSGEAVDAGTAVTPGEETSKTYYEQLLDGAITDAPEEDVNYIEEVIGLSSTSIGQEDSNPITAEMRAKATENAPASTADPAVDSTATMLADVRASLGKPPISTDKPDTEIANQDSAYIAALNAEDRSQIQKSEERIADLQKQLQAKIDAAQTAPATTVSTNNTQAETKTTAPTTVDAAQPPAETSLLSSIKAQASTAVSALIAMTSGISQDIWRLIGGLAAAIIGIMVLLGLRRRRDEDEVAAVQTEDSEVTATGSSINIADIATKSMQHEPDDSAGFEDELHGSSLFDLSDESFMASEVIQDDSSLFTMDDNDDSLTDMDSTQIGQQSTTQAVDVDPIAEAEVYLAYDRKEQAIEVLEQALSTNPDQSSVVIKLLGLYQSGENVDGFTRLFESSVEHIDDESEWNKIKQMAKDVVPEHAMLADDFDSSIPVLLDEITNNASSESKPESGTEASASSESTPDLKLASSEDKTQYNHDKIMDSLNVPMEEDIDDENLNISLEEASDMESLSIPMADDESVQLDEELDSAVEEINQHEPDTALALAKAYIELGEEDIAKDFLSDVISDGNAELISEAEEMLAKLN